MNYDIKPVLKWAGGKRQLIKYLKNFYPVSFNNYFEPFIGGASVLFDIQPEAKLYINDFNKEIIDVYRVIKNNPEELITELRKHNKLHSKDYYYLIRDLDRNAESFDSLSDVEKAARTIYLNRTCFNGLYRVNRKGYFNTPMGRYNNPLICDELNIINVSNFFNDREIIFSYGDFSTPLKAVQKNDFVYLDPPYFPISTTSSFTDYTKVGFSKEDQIRLYQECVKINDNGAFFMHSNSDTDFIRNLYKDFVIEKIPVKRFINAKADARTEIFELLIKNY